MPEIKCSNKNCEKMTYVAPHFLSEKGVPLNHELCSDCYIPEKPTDGWLKNRASMVDEFDYSFYESLKKDQQENYCRKLLKLKKMSKKDKKDKEDKEDEGR